MDEFRDYLEKFKILEPERTIGNVVSSGCFCLKNSDIIDLYERLPIGARVIVNQAPVI